MRVVLVAVERSRWETWPEDRPFQAVVDDIAGSERRLSKGVDTGRESQRHGLLSERLEALSVHLLSTGQAVGSLSLSGPDAEAILDVLEALSELDEAEVKSLSEPPAVEQEPMEKGRGILGSLYRGARKLVQRVSRRLTRGSSEEPPEAWANQFGRGFLRPRDNLEEHALALEAVARASEGERVADVALRVAEFFRSQEARKTAVVQVVSA